MIKVALGRCRGFTGIAQASERALAALIEVRTPYDGPGSR